MLKFLLIIFLISYLVYKVGGFLVRMLFINATQQHYQRSNGNPNPQSKKPRNGNVNIDFMPEDGKKKKADFKGGDYVDYEEVKD